MICTIEIKSSGIFGQILFYWISSVRPFTYLRLLALFCTLDSSDRIVENCTIHKNISRVEKSYKHICSSSILLFLTSMNLVC